MADHRITEWFGGYTRDSTTYKMEFNTTTDETTAAAGIVLEADTNANENITTMNQNYGVKNNSGAAGVKRTTGTDGLAELTITVNGETFSHSIADENSTPNPKTVTLNWNVIFPVGGMIGLRNVNPPADSIYSTFNSTFLDPNRIHKVKSVTYDSSASETKIVVNFPTSEASGKDYAIGDEGGTAKVYANDFRQVLYGICKQIWNKYNTFTKSADFPLNFTASNSKGAFDTNNNCFIESFTFSFKRDSDSTGKLSAKSDDDVGY